MNQGFAAAATNEWVLFLGSDDWIASPKAFSTLFDAIGKCSPSDLLPDLLVFRGRYVDSSSNLLGRSTKFVANSYLDSNSYRRALFLGQTPPHQCTIFGPGARRRLDRYSPFFRLSADLFYFLQLSRFSDLSVQAVDFEFVHMSSGGISARQRNRRLYEVTSAYLRRFGPFWCIPFSFRYLRRILSFFS